MSTKYWIAIGLGVFIIGAFFVWPWLRRKGADISQVLNDIDKENQR